MIWFAWFASKWEYPNFMAFHGPSGSGLLRWSNGTVLFRACGLLDVHSILILCSRMFVFDGMHVHAYSMSPIGACCIIILYIYVYHHHYPHDLWIARGSCDLPVLSSHHQHVYFAKAGRCVQCRCCDVRLGGLVGTKEVVPTSAA